MNDQDAFERLPLEERLDHLVHASDLGSPPKEWPELTQAKARAYLSRISIEQTVRLVKSTEHLDRLTRVLIFLTLVLVVLTVPLAIRT